MRKIGIALALAGFATVPALVVAQNSDADGLELGGTPAQGDCNWQNESVPRAVVEYRLPAGITPEALYEGLLAREVRTITCAEAYRYYERWRDNDRRQQRLPAVVFINRRAVYFSYDEHIPARYQEVIGGTIPAGTYVLLHGRARN